MHLTQRVTWARLRPTAGAGLALLTLAVVLAGVVGFALLNAWQATP